MGLVSDLPQIPKSVDVKFHSWFSRSMVLYVRIQPIMHSVAHIVYVCVCIDLISLSIHLLITQVFLCLVYREHGVQTHLQDSVFISFVYIPRNGITVSYGSSVFNILRLLHAGFHDDSANLHSHQQGTQFPFSLLLTTCCVLSF